MQISSEHSNITAHTQNSLNSYAQFTHQYNIPQIYSVIQIKLTI